MRKKYTWGSADRILFLAAAALLAALVWLFLSLVQSVQSQKKVCQSVVKLEKYEYNEAFLEQAKKLAGLRFVSPVCEVAVRLRVEAYTMDTTFVGADLSELQMRVKDAQDVPLGSIPAILIGEKGLSALTDQNGAAISEKKQQELLERYREVTWEYQLTGAGVSESAAAVDKVGAETAEKTEKKAERQDGVWLPCRVAAILSEPQEDIWLDYRQAESLLAAAGGDSSHSVTQILLTVQGEENYKRAKEAIEQGQKLSKK